MSILGLGNSYKDNAMAGFRQLANLETNRERANAEIAFRNDEMSKAKKTNMMSSTLTGAAMGGATFGAPGAIVGGLAGFLSSSLF